MKMKPFYVAELPKEAFDYLYVMKKFNITKEQAEREVERARKQVIMMNNAFQVNITEIPAVKDDEGHILWPAMTHLSIKRRDKKVIHDWRDLQQIKNMILGPEYEAVELYPAESRKVDSANQFHLFALADGKDRFPFGYRERLVTSESPPGGKQRPLDEEAQGVAGSEGG
jgi:hypothetical protein